MEEQCKGRTLLDQINMWIGLSRKVPSGMRLEFGGGISGNMRQSFQAARSIG